MTGAATEKEAKLEHPFFISLGGTLLMAALFTDFMYSSNGLMQWSNFSAWLIAGGLVLALISATILLAEVALGRAGTIRWLDFILLAVAVVLSIVNVLVHTRDAWTSVVSTGITLSAIVAGLLLVAGIRGGPGYARGDGDGASCTCARTGDTAVSARILRLAGTMSALILVAGGLGACSDKGSDPMRQYGPNPWLPEPTQYLLPPMSVPQAVGWKP